jgi:integrase
MWRQSPPGSEHRRGHGGEAPRSPWPLDRTCGQGTTTGVASIWFAPRLTTHTPLRVSSAPRSRSLEAAIAIPTPEVVRNILEASEPRFRAFVGLCAFAGLRLGETGALQIGDIDFLRRQVRVRRQVQRLNGSFEIRLPKYNSERTVHVPDALLRMLSEHVALGLPYDWLFAEVEDVPPHQNTVGYRWRTTSAGRSVGRPDARPAPLLRLRADRLRLRRGRRPARPRARQANDDAHHLRTPRADDRRPRQGRRNASGRRSRSFW